MSLKLHEISDSVQFFFLGGTPGTTYRSTGKNNLELIKLSLKTTEKILNPDLGASHSIELMSNQNPSTELKSIVFMI
jgi:hypothetical protein